MKGQAKVTLIILLFGCLIFIIIGTAWLSIGLLAICLLYWMAISDNVSIKGIRRTNWISYPFYILTIIFFSIGIRVFIIEIYAIPSVSMEDTILPGDKVLMSKLSYGPRLPSSPFEIPWINIACYFNKEYRARIDSVWWKYKRLKGFSKIKHNDVIIFISPKNSEEILVKRCLGLPGDTLLIKEEKVFANHYEIPEKGTIKIISRILFNNYTLASPLFDSLSLIEYRHQYGLKNSFSTYLNNNQKQTLLSFRCIDSIIIEKNRPDVTFETFPYDNLFHWSVDNFGPLVIPAKGMKIQLNETNYLLYKKIIKLYEMTDIIMVEGNYFLNGDRAANYTFKNNYYFMLGDNRHDSNDSRYWGFVPEANIIGKAVIVFFSDGKDGFRWKRIFRKIT